MSTGGAGRDDFDARFADIVARWDDPPAEALDRDDQRGRLSSNGTAPHEATAAAPIDPDPGTPHARAGDEDAERIGAGDDGDRVTDEGDSGRPGRVFSEPTPWRLHEPPEDDEEEGFEPPPPRPLPSFFDDWPFYLALVGLVGGPVWLLYLALFASTEHSQMWTAGALTAAGFVTLVLRQPRERDEDEPDDGAQV